MGQDFIPVQGSKKQKYEHIIQQMQHRIDPSNHPESNRSNLVAMLKAQFNWWWVGYYFVHKNKLVLGSFQGPPACTNIFQGDGVCGTSWKLNKSIVVKNVNEFEGHIACSSKSQSQIVVPIRKDEKFVGLLDVDSQNLADFDQVDQQYLERILKDMQKLNQFDDWK